MVRRRSNVQVEASGGHAAEPGRAGRDQIVDAARDLFALPRRAPADRPWTISETRMTLERTLEELLRTRAAEAGSVAALLDSTGVRATHDDLRRIRDGGRVALRECGVGREDRVAVMMSGDWQLPAALLAAMSAASTATIDPHLTDSELRDQLAVLAPRAIFADARTAPRLHALDFPGARILNWEAERFDAVDAELPEPQETALLVFTSGTTAAPKLVRLTQLNIATAARSVAGTLRLGPTDRALNAMPLYHGHGIFPGTLAPLVAGGGTICARPQNAAQLLDVVRATGPTWYSAAPVVHHSFLTMARSAPEVRAAMRLRAVRSTSSALPRPLLVELEETFGAPVVEAYAMSEVPGQLATNPLEGPRKTGSVGLPAEGVEIVLLTDSGELTRAPGAKGEVLVRGANVMAGYVGLPDRDQPFLDGWLRTGDQATLDEDGYLTIGGRVVDTISRGAEKFAPAEVEVVLAEHPAVREVVVYGRAHPTLGEEAAAAVVLNEGAAATEGELIEFAARRLATYKVPVQVDLLSTLPRGSTGKIVRRRLRDQAARSAAGTGRRLVRPE